MLNKIKKAIEILKKGGVVAYPTDTSYGLAVDATNFKAVKNLYKLKGRDFKYPIHVIFPNITWLEKIVKLNKSALLLMNKFMPGPLTLVLPLNTNSKSFQLLSSGTKSLGIRLPNNKISLELVRNFKKPITTTSANVSGKPDNYSIEAVKKQFSAKGGSASGGKNLKNQPDYYFDGGKLKRTKPSTVVRLIGHATILREGPISEKQIKQILSAYAKASTYVKTSADRSADSY